MWVCVGENSWGDSNRSNEGERWKEADAGERGKGQKKKEREERNRLLKQTFSLKYYPSLFTSPFISPIPPSSSLQLLTVKFVAFFYLNVIVPCKYAYAHTDT